MWKRKVGCFLWVGAFFLERTIRVIVRANAGFISLPLLLFLFFHNTHALPLSLFIVWWLVEPAVVTKKIAHGIDCQRDISVHSNLSTDLIFTPIHRS